MYLPWCHAHALISGMVVNAVAVKQCRAMCSNAACHSQSPGVLLKAPQPIHGVCYSCLLCWGCTAGRSRLPGSCQAIQHRCAGVGRAFWYKGRLITASQHCHVVESRAHNSALGGVFVWTCLDDRYCSLVTCSTKQTSLVFAVTVRQDAFTTRGLKIKHT